MLMCTRCKKRPAVVFVSNGVDGQPTQGLCLVCARELGIKPVNDITVSYTHLTLPTT